MSFKPEYFGKYILLEKLASGGMAEVFLGKTLGAEGVAKLVAIKRILPQFSKSEEFIAMFKEEAKICVNLAHPNIVAITEFGIEQEQFYICMEYVEGRNLRQILNRMKETNKNFAVEQAVYVINETARGLDHAHRCIDGQTGKPLNIIHRDISPQNLMLSFEANVKVVDFGIAKAESQAEATRAGTLKGKFSYMSPEQAEGLEVDSRTDVFSLGIVLWEILANDRLFLANNEMNTLRKIKECHIPSLHKLDPKISPDLERVVNKSLARDKNLRYQSAAEFHKDLNSFLNRNHPDFSPQDFSVTMKQLFAEELLESRRKLIEYAKVSFSKQVDEKTVYIDVKNTSTGTRTEASVTPTPIENQTGKTPAINMLHEGTDTRNRRLGTLQPHNGRMTGGQSQTQNSINNQNSPYNRTMTQSKQTSSGSGPGVRPMVRPMSSDSKSGRSQPFQAGNTGTDYRPRKSGSSMGTLFLFLMIAGVGAYFFTSPEAVGPIMCNISPQFCKTPTPVPPPGGKPTPLPQPTPVGMVKATILSSPAGSQVFVNGVLRGTTPVEIPIPQSQTSTITVKREGYSERSQAVQPERNGQTFSFELAKMKTGYISIRVVPGDAELFINDVKLAQSPPIEMYAVPANTQLKIRAINQYTGTGDETTTSVRENSHQLIQLFLKKPTRAPTGGK